MNSRDIGQALRRGARSVINRMDPNLLPLLQQAPFAVCTMQSAYSDLRVYNLLRTGPQVGSPGTLTDNSVLDFC